MRLRCKTLGDPFEGAHMLSLWRFPRISIICYDMLNSWSQSLARSIFNHTTGLHFSGACMTHFDSFRPWGIKLEDRVGTLMWNSAWHLECLLPRDVEELCCCPSPLWQVFALKAVLPRRLSCYSVHGSSAAHVESSFGTCRALSWRLKSGTSWVFMSQSPRWSPAKICPIVPRF